MSNPFSSAIQQLGGVTLTLTRATSAISVSSTGQTVAGTTTTATLIASVQPLSGRELERLPDGERTTEHLKLYTTSPVHTFADATGYAADQFTYDGYTWEIESVEKWPNSTQGYWKAIARKVPT